MLKKLHIIIAVIIGVLTLAGLGYREYASLAKVEQVEAVEENVNDLRATYRADKIQQRIWQLEDRYYGKDMPQSVKEEYRKLKRELEEIYKRK